MKQRDILMLMDGIAPAIVSLLGKAIAPVVARMEAAEKRIEELSNASADIDLDEIIGAAVEKALNERVPKEVASLELKIEDDELKKVAADVLSIVSPTVERLANEIFEVREMVRLFPVPKDGAPGERGADGKSVTVEDVLPIVENVVSAALAVMPIPKDGAPGQKGEPGARGDVGDPGPEGPAGKDASPEMVAAMVVNEIDKRMQEIQLPRDGTDGRDGRGLGGLLIDHGGNLVVTFTDGSVQQVGMVVGRDGVDGKNGEPGAAGLGFDDLEIKHDGGRVFNFRMMRGEQVKEFAFTVPVVIDRGVFKDGEEYAAGDGVTWGGSYWIAQSTTKDKPGTSDSFRLAVKKGRDGKDGRDLGPPPPSPPVKLK